jgi:hypothetical protein
MKTIRYLLSAALLAAVVGCGTLQNIVDDAPAAQTPTGLNVLAILTRGGGWTNVGVNGSGEFEILPGGLPSGGVRLLFSAPYPATLRVTLDGAVLPKFEDIPTGTDPGIAGYFRITNINANTNPTTWAVAVRPPNAKLMSTRYVIGVSHVSINPRFRDSNGNNQASAPLHVTAVAQKSYVLTTLFPGPGHGRVTIDAVGGAAPVNTFCEADCSTNFGQSVTVSLTARPSAGQTFSGWSGACTNTSAVCAITMNGQATAVAATFVGSSSSGPVQASCPPLAAPAGFSYFNKPQCDSQNVFNDPSPDLRCNAQGYFCCANKNGVNDPRCGADHASFPATCHLYGNPNVKLEPSGCYLKD